MADENDKKENKFEHLTPEQAQNAQKAVTKLEAVKALKQVSNPHSDWTLTQEILQEIIATHKIANPDKVPRVPALVEDLKREIEGRYKDELELKEILLESIPSNRAVGEWLKKKGWNEAVWDKLRDSNLFSQEKRALMINAVFQRGMDRDTQAAKIWLTLSGDYSEKVEVKDQVVDKYREINKILHGNKKED
jgi:hypothetical protein